MRGVNCKKLKAVAALKALLNPLLSILLLAGLSAANSAWALNPGDILTIETNADIPLIGGSDPTQCGGSSYNIGSDEPALPTHGSCFSMEVAPNFATYTPLRGFNGLVIGTTQTASGAHSGNPDGTEIPGIDQPWAYFNSTGMHFTTPTLPVNEIIANSVLNFSGWTVTWNNVAAIDMGGGAHHGYTDGQAQITCNPANCANGATYTLGYTATVPTSSPNFPNVKYSLRLEGKVIVPGALASLPVGIAHGTVGTTIRVTEAQLQAAGIPTDTTALNNLGGNGYSNSGGYYDFVTPTATGGGTTLVVIPLTVPLPTDFVYRSYTATGGWSTFVADANNNIKSAPGSSGGTCPAPGSLAYASPATAGHYCLQLTIQDGGPNDADGATNSSVSDTGGVATPLPPPPPLRTSDTSGCSLSANPVNPLERSDWWLLLGFVAWLGFVIRRKRA